MVQLWIAIQNLLTAAANLSKALWGQGGKLAVEREPLRRSLGVLDESPLRDVAMRNHFEHFDERLDRWWATSKSRNYMDLTMLQPGVGVMGLLDDQDMFRVLDPAQSEVVFWGERFNLRAITQAAHELLPIVVAEASKPHWSDDLPPSIPGSGQ